MLVKSLKVVGKSTINFAKEHSTTILTGMTVVGVGVTAVLSGKAAVKAYQVIEEEEYSRGIPMTKKEKFVKTWKIYIPPFAAAVATASISIGCHALNKRTHAVLLESYLAEAALRRNFEAKARDIIGDKKVDKVKHEMNADKINANPPDEKMIIPTKAGRTLFLDGLTGRYFYSDIEFVRHAINNVNEQIIKDGYASMNDFYYELEIPSVQLGAEQGWHRDFDGQLDIVFDTQMTPYGEPCIVLDYGAHPRYGYDKLY